MKIYYMRDNHTFRPIPLDVDKAERVLREEIESGYVCGSLCARLEGKELILHASGSAGAEQFFAEARAWIEKVLAMDSVSLPL